jgi:hypothetical protein
MAHTAERVTKDIMGSKSFHYWSITWYEKEGGETRSLNYEMGTSVWEK